MGRLATAVLIALLVAAVPAHAADPGRWRETGRSPIPIVYYQGVTSDDRGHLFFDGVFSGLYRSDAALREQARADAEIPPQVTATEGYNHMGDLSWDAAEGGRVLLPLECYYPGTPGDANTCHTGSIGVADPTTLAWRYYVKLDPAEIPKAMWDEVSPDGSLLWTSSGSDLLAYRTADITPAHAAPAAPPVHSVRRLAGAVPPAGITGATFVGSRLFVAGQDDRRFRVWSIDLADGSRRLEIERTLNGESEGLDTVDALGGTLHWIVTPADPRQRPPTYKTNVLLHFVPNTLSVTVHPKRIVTGRATALRITVRRDGKPVRSARVKVAGRHARTGRDGRARITVTRAHRGTLTVSASARRIRSGHARVRVIRAG
jgi:hypothetical protein